ncbi:MAG: hypothetical protein HQL69_23290 [Magnetococcales bacterium]|nr:hypothetical protein [Magnetococcales bacterium]
MSAIRHYNMTSLISKPDIFLPLDDLKGYTPVHFNATCTSLLNGGYAVVLTGYMLAGDYHSTCLIGYKPVTPDVSHTLRMGTPRVVPGDAGVTHYYVHDDMYGPYIRMSAEALPLHKLVELHDNYLNGDNAMEDTTSSTTVPEWLQREVMVLKLEPCQDLVQEITPMIADHDSADCNCRETFSIPNDSNDTKQGYVFVPTGILAAAPPEVRMGIDQLNRIGYQKSFALDNQLKYLVEQNVIPWADEASSVYYLTFTCSPVKIWDYMGKMLPEALTIGDVTNQERLTNVRRQLIEQTNPMPHNVGLVRISWVKMSQEHLDLVNQEEIEPGLKRGERPRTEEPQLVLDALYDLSDSSKHQMAFVHIYFSDLIRHVRVSAESRILQIRRAYHQEFGYDGRLDLSRCTDVGSEINAF